MASAAPVRDWATTDYYALLGIEPSADAETVTRAFREQAKQSHPDATRDAVAISRFHDLTAAYAVLGDARTRCRYDEVRATVRAPAVPSGAVVSSAGRRPAARKPWSRRKAWSVLLAGVLVFWLGVGAALLTWTMHAHDAHQRARFVPITATRVDENGASMVSFVTSTGQRVVTREPEQHGDPSALGPTVGIRYDPSDPAHVIVDASSAGRDITFTIVALKLLVCGPVFTVLGYRRLRTSRRVTA